jgi:hypothetical protein
LPTRVKRLPSWRIVVEQEIDAMSRFKQFLGPEDRAVFDDLLTQCKHDTSSHGFRVIARPVRVGNAMVDGVAIEPEGERIAIEVKSAL